MTFTKEQLTRIIESADDVITALAGTNEDCHRESDDMIRLWDHLNDVAAPPAIVKKLAELALAGMEAEPVAYMWESDRKDVDAAGYYRPEHKIFAESSVKRYGGKVVALFAAPPAPVVPDECPVEIRELLASHSDALFHDGDAQDIWNACRAAMLQGAENTESPTTMQTAPALDSSPKIAESPSSNSPVIPDGYVVVPIEPTEDMIVYGFESEPDEDFSDPAVWEEYQVMSGCQQAAHRAKLCWAAMIAAAPKLGDE
ncbi:hypothetical protein ACVVCI_002515 [Escherichia coli]